DLPRLPKEPTRGMLLPSALLVLACLLVGTLPNLTIGPLLAATMRSILGPELPEYRLMVWHGFTIPLAMSFIAMVGGLSFYLWLRLTGRAMAPTPVLSKVSAGRLFDMFNVIIARGAGRLGRLTFSRRLQVQMLLIMLVSLGVALMPFMVERYSIGTLPLTPLDPLFAVLWVIGATCAIGTALQAKFHRLAALILLGGAGLVTSLTFAWFSAPDQIGRAHV